MHAALAALQERLGARCRSRRSSIASGPIILFEGWVGAGKKSALQAPGRRRGTRATVDVHASVASDDGRRRPPLAGALLERASGGGRHDDFLSQLVSPRSSSDRVARRVDDKGWARACDEINEFEAQQRDHGTLIVKLFFHVSADEQQERLTRAAGRSVAQHLLADEAVARPSQRGPGHRRRRCKKCSPHTDTRWAPWQVIDANDAGGGALPR